MSALILMVSLLTFSNLQSWVIFAAGLISYFSIIFLYPKEKSTIENEKTLNSESFKENQKNIEKEKIIPLKTNDDDEIIIPQIDKIYSSPVTEKKSKMYINFEEGDKK